MAARTELLALLTQEDNGLSWLCSNQWLRDGRKARFWEPDDLGVRLRFYTDLDLVKLLPPLLPRALA